MKAIMIIAIKELRDSMRNRWILATIALLGMLALALSMLGSAPTGAVRASALDVSVISLTSLSVYLLPLIALMLSFDAMVGEFERGTMLLLLTYPVTRWQVMLGKFFGHVSILMTALLIGYGCAMLITIMLDGGNVQGWQPYLGMMLTSLMLGTIFIALGYLISVFVRERATAAGSAIAVWLIFVVLYDLALFSILLLDKEQAISAELFSTLMLLSPTDAYRVFNMSYYEGISQLAGVSGIASSAGINSYLLLSTMLLWALAPLAAALFKFQRKEL